MICKLWNFRERRDHAERAPRKRAEGLAEQNGKGRRSWKEEREEVERTFPSECRERAIPVIAPVYIGPLASGVSRTAFVFEVSLRRGWERSRARARFEKIALILVGSREEPRDSATECALSPFPQAPDKPGGRSKSASYIPSGWWIRACAIGPRESPGTSLSLESAKRRRAR